MTTPKQSAYPNFDVLTEWEEWDPSTQLVIKKRLSFNHTSFFSEDEKDLLLAFIPHLFPTHLGEISIDVLALFDSRCKELTGYPKGCFIKTNKVIRNGLQRLSGG